MREAICFGWIDTTVKRVDENKYLRFFSRRNKNSKWSYNTLSYAKELIKEKRMTPNGIKFYKEGLKKKPHDFDLLKNPDMPDEMKKVLRKNKKARENFDKLAPSLKRLYFRQILSAKMPETKTKRIGKIVREMENKE